MQKKDEKNKDWMKRGDQRANLTTFRGHSSEASSGTTSEASSGTTRRTTGGTTGGTASDATSEFTGEASRLQ